MIFRRDSTLIPVVIVILAMTAFIAIFSFSIWPSAAEFDDTPSRIRIPAQSITNSAEEVAAAETLEEPKAGAVVLPTPENTPVEATPTPDSNTNSGTTPTTPAVQAEPVEPTSNWIVYQGGDSFGGYSFKHPSTWRISKYDPQYVGVIPKKSGSEVAKEAARVDFYPVPGENPIPPLVVPVDTTVAGKAAQQGRLEDAPSQIATLVTLNTGVLAIYWPSASEFAPTYDKILASFTFAN